MGVNCLILAGNSMWTRDDSSENLIHVPRMKHAGPYRIATELRQHGFTVQVADTARFTSLTPMFQEILRKFISKETLWVGFSTNFLFHILGYPVTDNAVQEAYARSVNPKIDNELKKFVALCKHLNPKIRFVVGGIKTYDFSNLGFYHFRGHVEDEIVKFTKECLTDSLILDRKVIVNKEFAGFPQSSIRYLPQDMVLQDRALPIEISRGCIFNCKFCSFPLRNKTKGDHIKDYAVLRDEFIYNYEQYGITHYIFADDTYNDSLDKMTDLYEQVFSQLPFKLTFAAYIRLDLLLRIPESQQLLYDSGLRSAAFGIESLNHQSAKAIGKGVDPMKQIELLRTLRSTIWPDVLFFSNFILGLPNDTKESLTNTVEFLMSEDNPLNLNTTYTLYISSRELSSNKMYSSEFDLNATSYGYEVYNDANGIIKWRLPNNDLDYDWCQDLQHEFFQDPRLHDRKASRLAGFYYSAYINEGIPQSDLHDLTMTQLFEKHDIIKIAEAREQEYYRKLLELDI